MNKKITINLFGLVSIVIITVLLTAIISISCYGIYQNNVKLNAATTTASASVENRR